MMLSDARDYIASLGIAEHVYMGKLPDKEDKSIGVYNSKHQYPYRTVLGGPSLEGYGEKYVTVLVHWNKSPRDTERTATELFEKLRTARDINVNDETIKFFQPLYPVQDVGTEYSEVCRKNQCFSCFRQQIQTWSCQRICYNSCRPGNIFSIIFKWCRDLDPNGY